MTATFADLYASRNVSSHKHSLAADGSVPVIVLDGGMGTQLEGSGHPDIKKSPLWSASVIIKDPEAIVKAHTAFLEAGADIIITNT